MTNTQSVDLFAQGICGPFQTIPFHFYVEIQFHKRVRRVSTNSKPFSLFRCKMYCM